VFYRVLLIVSNVAKWLGDSLGVKRSQVRILSPPLDLSLAETSRWQAQRQPDSEKSRQQALADAITPVTLRQKRLHGLAVTIDELVLVYRRHTYEYYRKNGEVTREAKTIDEVIRVLRKKHARSRLKNLAPRL